MLSPLDAKGSQMSFGETFLQLLVWLPIIMLWGFALVDLFHTHMSGLAKALWALVIVLLPIIGIILYFTFRPVQDNRVIQEAPDSTVPLEDPVDSLAKLHDLNRRGVIDDNEYAEYKALLVR